MTEASSRGLAGTAPLLVPPVFGAWGGGLPRRLSLGLTGLALAALATAAAAPAGRLAYLRGGWAWAEARPGARPVQVPHSRGAALLALSPADGGLAFLTGPPGADLHAAQVPPLRPWLSRPPYAGSVPLKALVPGPTSSAVRARWLRWEPGGRALIAGTDGGPAGWNLATRQTFVPDPSARSQSRSWDGEVTATLGTVQSPDDVGVLLYGPGARPGTEVFSRRLPQNLMRALRAAPQPAIRRFVAELDPRAQADDVNWTLTAPQVTRDGRRVYFASNAGWGVGSAGTTTSAVFEVDVATVGVRVLGALGTFAGHVLEVQPSPDGRRLLLVVARHSSNADVTTLVYAADLARGSLRELAAHGAPKGTQTVLDSACWLADSRHVALSVAHPRPQNLTAANGFTPPAGAHTLLVRDAGGGQTVHRVPGATGVSCGPA